MTGPAASGDTDCGDALRQRAVDAANHHLEAGLATPVLLVGLRADGREFMLFLDHCYPEDPARRREFISFILGRDGVIAYAYACCVAGIDAQQPDRLHVVAQSRAKLTLSYYRLAQGAGNGAWQRCETHDFRAGDAWLPHVPLPHVAAIDDVSRLAEYASHWTSLRNDGTRCFWRWNVGCQQPGFPFPSTFAGRSIVGFADLEASRPGSGYRASYAIVDDEILDLCAYAGARTRDRSDDDLVAAELARAGDTLLRVRSKALRRQIERVANGVLAAALPAAGRFRFSRFRVESAGSVRVSFLVLARFRALYLQLRLTTADAEGADHRLEQAAAWLASYLGWLDSGAMAANETQPAEHGVA